MAAIDQTRGGCTASKPKKTPSAAPQERRKSPRRKSDAEIGLGAALASAQRTLLDSLPDVAWIKDTDSRLTLVNRAFAERYGIAPEAAVGKRDSDIYPEAKAAQLRAEDLSVMATRQPLRYESSLVVDGAEHWVEIVKAPVIDHAGKVIGTVGTSRDITARKLAEQASHLTQQRLELALEGSGLVLWDTDVRTRSTHLSEGWARLLGHAPGDTHTTVEELMALVHPDDLKLARRLSQETLQGQRDDYVTEHRVRAASGHWKWILSRGRVTARDAAGVALRMSGTNLDITARKSMEESLRHALGQSETLLETTPTAIAVVRDGIIGRCNAAMDRLFGFSGQPVRPMAALFPSAADWVAARAQINAALAREQSYNGELELKHSDGTRFWVVAAARPIHGGAPEILFALTDVTPQRRLAEELEAARRQADAANRAKSGFLATMSHEIRTPMNGVLGMLELLELSPLDAEQHETVTLARDSAIALLRLIDDILDFSKIEAGQLEIKPEPVSLATLASRAASVYLELASRKGLRLECTVDPKLSPAHVADGLRVTQILNNLLSNAIKFTARGEVRLVIDSVRRDATHETVRIRVTDQGIGVTPEQQQRLFQPFVQGDAETTRRYGGTGLGLSICRRLTALMNGEIHLDSIPGQGTTVTATLHLPTVEASALQDHQEAQRRETAAATRHDAGARRAAILIAEDHPVNRLLIQRQVAMLGHAVDFAADGVEALDKWAHGHYDLLLTDCHMPNKDGYELAREIRRREAETATTQPIPIIACTASALGSDGARCFEAGMNDFLPKPITLTALRSKIDQWLGAPAATAVPAPPAPAAVPDPAPACPLELSALEPFTGGDAALQREILGQFRAANNEDVVNLTAAHAAGDLPALSRSSHRIKGASRMIGALPFAAAAERLELAARAGDGAGAEQHWPAFVLELDRLNACLDDMAGAPGACPPGVTPPINDREIP